MNKKPHIVYRWDELRLSSGNPILHNSFRHTRELRVAICSNALRAARKTLMNPKSKLLATFSIVADIVSASASPLCISGKFA